MHAGLAGGAGEGLELLGRLLAQFQPLQVGGQGVGQLLPAGLDGEVLLGVGDLGLARVAVLGDQVAGEAGEVVIGHFLHRALAPDDQFARAQNDGPDRYPIARKRLWPS